MEPFVATPGGDFPSRGPLELADQIELFRQFFEVNASYGQQLHEQVRLGHAWVNIDFGDLAKHNPELADLLLDQPEDVLKACQIAIEKMDLPRASDEVALRIEPRMMNLPKEVHLDIRTIRSKHLNKFIQMVGIVRQKSDVRPQMTAAKFECPSCGNIIPVLQLDQKFKEPSRCGCGRKGKFKLLSKELVDAQSITLEEAPEDLDGGEQPKRLKVFLKNDLVSPLTDKRTNPGAKITVVGVIKEVPIILATGGQSTRFDLIVDANFVDGTQEDFGQLEVSPEEEKEIRELSQDPDLFEKFVASIAPSIYGHEPIKQALILQMFGGMHKNRDKGVKSRGDIHVLLIGDPGSGKSQMLKRISNIAPKARFVSGKGASGAGLTAAVVKDEFLKGWALEAGALVLANRGIVCIDELDKMSKDDTSAMHEALEQQCYEYNTNIMFADGSERKIGEYVEGLFRQYPEKVVRGKDCFVLQDGIVDESILTTDWEKVFPTRITRVSKHITTEKLYQITFTNGRSITVTPEHPVFFMQGGKIQTKRADEVGVNDFVPVPRTLPIAGEVQKFSTSAADVFNARATRHITVPEHNDAELYRLVGYVLSEGSKELNRGKVIGINFTNKDEVLLEDFRRCAKHVFNIPVYAQMRIDDHDPRMMLRYVSRELATFLQREMPELLEKAAQKAIPAKLMRGQKEDIAQLLLALFEGDGHVAVKQRTIRIGYGSNSRTLVEQIQDLLLRFGIRSSITAFKDTYKVNITGYENIRLFHEHIGFLNQKRLQKVESYLSTKMPIRTCKEVIPGCAEQVISLMEKYRVALVGKTDRATMKHQYMVKKQGIARSHLQKLVGILDEKQLNSDDQNIVENLKALAFGEIGFERVKNVEIVPAMHPWTYDVTIEPTHTFISQGLVLHNTVTISKANIQATLRSETTVLAAANPKFGRFDPYEMISKQIELPPTLLNRFDLIFPVRDMPDKTKDEKLASFILNLHKEEGGQEGIISPEKMKKYIAYARQRVYPKLTDAAMNEIKDYYVKMRGGDDKGETVIKAIPISARQLEALVRLSEASAKLRLSDKVTKRDAQTAIELVHYCLQQIGMDPDTGKIDIDRITTGISASQRSHISMIKEVIQELEATVGKMIPIDDVVREAGIKGIADDTTHEVIEKLKRGGDIYSPKHGFIARL